MTYKAKKKREQLERIEPPPAIFYESGYIARIDRWIMFVKRKGQPKEAVAFGVNLSYSESLSLEPRWIPVKRYDCAHHRVEKHEYWISHHSRRVREWEGKPLEEVFELARRDLESNYADYIAKMRQKRRHR